MLYSIVLNIYYYYIYNNNIHDNNIHNNNIFFQPKNKLNDFNEIHDKLEKGLLYK